jgi:hypothetical protein
VDSRARPNFDGLAKWHPGGPAQFNFFIDPNSIRRGAANEVAMLPESA